MDIVSAFNGVEAVWWTALGGAILLGRTRSGTATYRRCLAVALIAFGITDVIEVWSGAWWRPWWLAGVKIILGVMIVAVSSLWWWRARNL